MQHAGQSPGAGRVGDLDMPFAGRQQRQRGAVVARAGVTLDQAELLRFFEGKVAKWWIPDTVFIVDELPHNATGKVQKLLLRERFAGTTR